MESVILRSPDHLEPEPLNNRQCVNCGAKTQSPLKKLCELCRTTMTADEKRAIYARKKNGEV